MFASLLGRRVGVNVPKARILEYTDGEWRRMKTKMFELAETEADKKKFIKELNRPQLMSKQDRLYKLKWNSVQEFVAGVSLEQLGSRAKEFLQGDIGKKRLQGVGSIIALDIVTNNWDR